MSRTDTTVHRARHLAAYALACLTLAAVSCSRGPAYRTFASPEDAVQALQQAVKAGNLDEVVAIFGPEGQDLIDSSDPAMARRNQQVFVAAVRERWSLEQGAGPDARVLVVGNEGWPFPVPIVKDRAGWRFDTAAGKEEVIARRIGRNELAAILISRTYVAAQHVYARRGHDGQPAGLYAAKFASDPERENGLYWPARAGRHRSPLGDLVARAAEGGTALGQSAGPSPFHGYYFRILTAQGPDARGGAKSYVVNGRMSDGFALVAWPAEYDVTGVMSFIVNHEGVVREKDLGPDTDATARGMAAYNPDASWASVQ
jgi:hypothetical protein